MAVFYKNKVFVSRGWGPRSVSESCVSALSAQVSDLLFPTEWPRAAPRGRVGGTVPHSLKGHFCKSSKTDEKILRVWGWCHQPYLNFSLSLSQVVFKYQIYIFYLIL